MDIGAIVPTSVVQSKSSSLLYKIHRGISVSLPLNLFFFNIQCFFLKRAFQHTMSHLNLSFSYMVTVTELHMNNLNYIWITYVTKQNLRNSRSMVVYVFCFCFKMMHILDFSHILIEHIINAYFYDYHFP